MQSLSSDMGRINQTNYMSGQQPVKSYGPGQMGAIFPPDFSAGPEARH